MEGLVEKLEKVRWKGVLSVFSMTECGVKVFESDRARGNGGCESKILHRVRRGLCLGLANKVHKRPECHLMDTWLAVRRTLLPPGAGM